MLKPHYCSLCNPALAPGAGVSLGPPCLGSVLQKSGEELQEDKCIQEVLDTLSMTLAEIPPPKPPGEPCPQPPATPPKVGPPPQTTPPQATPQTTPQTTPGEGKKKAEPVAELPDFPKSLPAGRAEQRRLLVEMCVRALFLCLSRFPQHYKSLYRLAFLYSNSKTHQVSPCYPHTSINMFSLYH